MRPSWMSFAVTAIIVIQFLTSESFLVKPLHTHSTTKSLQINTYALSQSFYWLCSFRAAVKVLETIQVAL